MKTPHYLYIAKKLVYIMLLKPIWQYSCSVWGSASNTQINRLQTFQNRVLRLITGAPWYVRNETLHSDLGIQTVNSILQTTYQQLHSTFKHHPNILIRQIPQNMPPARSDCRHLETYGSSSLANFRIGRGALMDVHLNTRFMLGICAVRFPM